MYVFLRRKKKKITEFVERILMSKTNIQILEYSCPSLNIHPTPTCATSTTQPCALPASHSSTSPILAAFYYNKKTVLFHLFSLLFKYKYRYKYWSLCTSLTLRVRGSTFICVQIQMRP